MLTQKIQESLARHLYCASKWMRLLFDAKLREASPFNADQPILMMVLKCDKSSVRKNLIHDAALTPDSERLIDSLIKGGYIKEQEAQLSLSEKGDEALAKIWCLHELAETIALKDVSEKEKRVLDTVIQKIYRNCGEIVPFESVS